MITSQQPIQIGRVIPMPKTSILTPAISDRIAISCNGKIQVIQATEILFLKSDSNYTEIHLLDGTTIVTSTTLKKYEAKLKPNKFMRVHNSYIIQRAQLKTFLPQQNKLILHNTQVIPVSRSKKEGLMKYLKLLMVSMVFLLFSIINAHAQQFNSWQQGAASDWFINVNWNAGTNYDCNCLNGNDIMFALDDDTFENYFTVERSHQNGTWVGSSQFETGPDASISVRGQSQISGGKKLDFIDNDPCGLSCSGAYNTAGVQMTTEPLRPPSNVTATYNANGTITFNWTVTTDIPDNVYLLTYQWVGFSGGNFLSKSVTSVTLCPPSDDATFSIWTRENVVNGHESTKVNIDIDQGPVSGGSVQGKVETLSGTGVEGVIVKATLKNPGNCINTLLYESMPTSSDGNYSISGLKYHSDIGSAEYEIEAFLDGNSFRTTPDAMSTDSTRTYFLTPSLNDYSGADFFSIRTYDLLGKVEVSNDCGLDDVLITAVGPSPSMDQLQTMTAGDGTFSLVLNSPGNYNIISRYQGIPFDTVVANVADNVVIPDIEYTKKDTIRGFSGAGCLEVIGEMIIEARTPTGCPITSVTTNPSGFYELIVPSIPLEVQVVGYDPQQSGLEYNDVYPAIDSIYELNIDSTYELNIQYRKPIKLSIENLPPPPCPSVQHPVLNQDEAYTITINIWEEIDICRADTGSVMISDDVSTFGVQSPIISNIPFSNGKIQYTLEAGDPALSAPFLKYINVTATVDNEVANISIPVIVSGTRIRTSTITSAPSDSIPLLILRDPPGDKSQAWFSTNNTTTYSQSYSHEVGGSVKLWAKAKAGIDIFGAAIWGQISGSLEVGGSRTTATETAVSLETTSLIETSPQNAFIGEDGDLVMGAAINFKYGLSDDRFFDLNTCSIVVDTSLIFSPETFESTYTHSVSFIKKDIIPKLAFLSQNQDTTEEARRKFASKLKVWEQILQLNREQKKEALKNPLETFSFDAGASQTSTLTGSSSSQSSLEFTTTIDAEIAVSAGVKGFGNALSGGIDVKIRSNWGGSEVMSSSNSTTVGYKWMDDDPGDNHFFDYAIDSVYGTPVFGVIGGASSCPHEDNTQFIDLVKLTFSNPIFIGQPGEEFADFPFSIQNLGETDVSNQYFIDLVDDSNPGATVTFNGNPIVDPGVLFSLNAGQVKTGTIRVTRPAGDLYTFEGIEFEAFAGCFASGNPNPDKTLKSTATISAFFMNDCSNINMTSPADNWLINQQSGTSIPVTMDQYVLGGIDTIRLMYANQRDGEWQKSNIDIPGPNLLAPPQMYNWEISDLPDGNYVLRWELVCGTTVNHSPRKTGKIDRTPPRVFGVEKPVTDLYFPGDEISCQFNEEINFANLNNSHIYLKLIPQGTFHPVNLQGENNEVIIIPVGDISMMYNQTFEAGVFGVVDLFGNPKSDTAVWEFVISEPDSDRDGVPDTQDKCPGGDDFKDTDMDGLPDDCDCVSTIASNGRGLTKAALDFDGSNDYLLVPNNPELIPTASNAVTIEGWINPTYKGPGFIVNVITASGQWPNRNHQIYLADQSNQLWITGTGQSTMISNASLPFSEWTHIAVVYDMSETRLYINGELDKVRVQALTATNLGFDISIGNQLNGGNVDNFLGQMDEMRYWNHARTQSEIQANMNIEIDANSTGLEAYYSFNDGTPFGENTDLTVSEDQTGNGHDGTMLEFSKTGISSNWVPSPVNVLDVAYDLCRTCTDTLNTAIDFDGINDRVSIPNNPLLVPTASNAMTLEAWVRPTGDSFTNDAIVASGDISSNNFSIFLNGGRNLWVIHGGLHVGATVIPYDQWTHISVVFDMTSITIYINGQLELSNPLSSTTNDISKPILLGEWTGQTYEFDGQMDDVRFWDHARTGQQIADHMFTELIGDESGLAAYYDFNEGLPSQDNAGLSLTDVTGNGNTGTLVEFNKFGMFSNWVKSPLRFSGDVDEDGRPDVCDNCIPDAVVMLENQILDGVYRARDEIILGNGIFFLPDANVTFRTPKITVSENITKPASVTIIVKDEACEE